MSLTNKTFLLTGTEIFTHYGYIKASFPSDFPWYFKALQNFEKEQKKKKKRKKESIVH